MSKDVEQLACKVVLTDILMYNMPEEVLDSYISRQLMHDLTNHLITHKDELPVNKTERRVGDNPFTREEVLTLGVNLISDEELRRLKDIENSYNQLLFMIDDRRKSL